MFYPKRYEATPGLRRWRDSVAQRIATDDSPLYELLCTSRRLLTTLPIDAETLVRRSFEQATGLSPLVHQMNDSLRDPRTARFVVASVIDARHRVYRLSSDAGWPLSYDPAERLIFSDWD